MTWWQAMLAAVLATIGRGRWWVAALAAFLVRGGLLVLLPAIVLVPNPAELEANLSPSLTSAAIGGPTPSLLAVVAAGLAVALLVVLAASLLGAWLDAGLAAEVATDEELRPVGGRLAIPVARAVVTRLAAHLPTLVAVVVGGLALGAATYAEILAPSGNGALAARVAGRAPMAVAAIVATWLVGEAWGGLAARRLGLGDGVAEALGLGLRDLVRPSGLATLVVTGTLVGLTVAATWLAAARSFGRAWPLVVDRADPLSLGTGLGLLVMTWGAGLWLVAVVLAFRQAAWTAEVLRRR